MFMSFLFIFYLCTLYNIHLKHVRLNTYLLQLLLYILFNSYKSVTRHFFLSLINIFKIKIRRVVTFMIPLQKLSLKIFTLENTFNLST